MKRTRFLLMILFLQLCVSMQAQIPQEVKKVLATCNEKMSNPAGIEIDMKVSAGIAFVKFNTAVKIKVWVSDSVFKFDINRYPGAKVIRK